MKPMGYVLIIIGVICTLLGCYIVFSNPSTQHVEAGVKKDTIVLQEKIVEKNRLRLLL